MGYSQWVDWLEEGKTDRWSNVGDRVARENCTHKNKESPQHTNIDYQDWCEDCDISEDSNEPMMNYVYPLEIKPTDEAILKVIKETNCTVMYNNDDDTHYLTLCGGGMDLSQDIALAYFYCETWIPFDLALNVSTQVGLSISKEQYKLMARAVVDSLKNMIGHAQDKIKEFELKLK